MGALAYLHALIVGDGAGACSLESAATLNRQAAALAVERRFAEGTPRTCVQVVNLRPPSPDDAQAIALPVLPVSASGRAATALSVSHAVVTGLSATVTVAQHPSYTAAPPKSLHLSLLREGAAWHVTLPVPSPQTIIAKNVPSASCIALWNRAVRSDAVHVPPIAAIPDKSVWASLGCDPKAAMFVQTPAAQYVILYATVNGWGPTVRSARMPRWGRTVWLDRRGVATAAVDASPDGTVPRLK
jgi:hypothetical protein